MKVEFIYDLECLQVNATRVNLHKAFNNINLKILLRYILLILLLKYIYA